MAAMFFTSIPFVVRTVQPVLEDVSADVEEAAQTLGARPWQIFAFVIWPLILPAFLAGATMSFARSLGEFGAVVFIAGNLPMETEIASLLIFIRLDEYNYGAAAALASVLLIAAFLLLFAHQQPPGLGAPPCAPQADAWGRRLLIALALVVAAGILVGAARPDLRLGLRRRPRRLCRATSPRPTRCTRSS